MANAKTRVFLGTGLLGSGFVKRFLDAGETPRVWNRSMAKAQSLVDAGAVGIATLEAAVDGAERIHICVTADAAVDSILETIAPKLVPGAIVLDHSTTLPNTTSKRAAWCAENNVTFLHCPVFMSPAVAAAGQGTMIAAGPKTVFDTVKDEIEPMSAKLMFVGERSDLAAAFKIVGNGFSLCMLAGLNDVFSVADGAGIAPNEVIDFLLEFDNRYMISGRGRNMANGKFDPSWALSMARKDVGLMLDTASGDPMVALPALAKHMDATAAEGHGDADVGVIAHQTIARAGGAS